MSAPIQDRHGREFRADKGPLDRLWQGKTDLNEALAGRKRRWMASIHYDKIFILQIYQVHNRRRL
jgi:hypothetical protein